MPSSLTENRYGSSGDRRKPATNLSIAVVAGATGFIGGEFLDLIICERHFDEVILVGKPRHLERLRALADKHQDSEAKVSVTEVGGLVEFFRKKPDSSEVVLADLTNRFLRDIPNEQFGDYLLERLKSTESLIAPLIRFKPYVLFPLSWHSLRPSQTYYSATKNAIEQMLIGYADQGAISLGRVLFFDTYGPEDPRDKLIPKLLRLRAEEVRQFISEPFSAVNLTDVQDAARGLQILCCNRAEGRHQIRFPEDTRVWEVAKLLGKWRGPGPSYYRANTSLTLPTSDAPAPPGWRPTVSPATGLSRLKRDY